jgi:protein-S-isoprenylcysteine O-methyltransferase Ste14
MNMKAIQESLFRYRGYIPIPFLAAMIVFAQPTATTMIVGGVLAVLGECCRFWGVAYAGSLTRVTSSVGAPEVIVSGPFAHVRNPLYVGNITTYVGIGIMANALFPWLAVGAFVWFVFQYTMIVLLEEEFLQNHFGEPYLAFKQNVPRFLPRLTPYRPAVEVTQPPRWDEAVRSERRTFQALGLVVAIVVALWMWR